MLTTQRKPRLSKEELKVIPGSWLGESHYDIIVDEDADIKDENGEWLLRYRRNAIDEKLCRLAWPVLREIKAKTDNRGNAGGAYNNTKRNAVRAGKFRGRVIKKDKTLSKSNVANSVKSGIIGYYDRYPRIPYCRMTAFNLNNADKFDRIKPFVSGVADVFKDLGGSRYQSQMEVIRKTNPDFFISGTPFTTITVNQNWRTAAHRDAGDYEEGMGVMNALTSGNFSGMYLCFPEYGVAVDMRTRGVLLANVHKWHGNTPVKSSGCYQRVSCIFYYRNKMLECGSAKEELTRAKKQQERRLYEV